MAKSEIAQRLKDDIIVAMKAKDKARLGVLRMMQAAVKQVEVDERRDLEDADVLKILTGRLPRRPNWPSWRSSFLMSCPTKNWKKSWPNASPKAGPHPWPTWARS